MKTAGMQHQLVGLERLAENPDAYMLACEQGTGKTWILLAEAERRYLAGDIEALLVVAPKGVHTNWVRREIPAHLECEHIAAAFRASGGKKVAAMANAVLDKRVERGLRILTINVDGLATAAGYRAAWSLVTGYRTMMVLDESHLCKNPEALRTKKVIAIGRQAVARRAATGTPIGQGPADIYSQFDYLAPGLIGTTSYRAFVAEYSVLMPPTSGLCIEVVRRYAPRLIAQYERAKADGDLLLESDLARQIARQAPQIIARDVNGRPKWKNLDKLHSKIDPFMYRVLKRDCLDLPDKIYSTHYFELSAERRRLYTAVERDLRMTRPDGIVDTYDALTVGSKLRQITSGFVMIDGEPHGLAADADNERLAALADLLETIDGPFIVWAHFREEIAAVMRLLSGLGIAAGAYYGDTKDADRERIIDQFQAGALRAIVVNQASGGTGLTLTAAQTAIYYSNDFSLIKRLQSEDRNHRHGTIIAPRYIDLVAMDTVDELVAAALQNKREVADAIIEAKK